MEGVERQLRRECQGECGVRGRDGVVHHSRGSWNDPENGVGPSLLPEAGGWFPF